jgi:exonuclease SbcC
MILEVRMKNWRSHADTFLRLQEGTNVLVGPIGSGKSSVLDAIEFALFGSIPAVESRKLKLEDLVRRGEERAEVGVRFLSPDGREYFVKRLIVRGKGTGWAEMKSGDGSVVIDGARNVTEKICDILKITRDLYERAIYSQQNRLDYVLELPASERKKRIDELLGLFKFEDVRKIFGSLAHRLERVADDLSTKLDAMKNDESILRLEEMRGEADKEEVLIQSRSTEMAVVERDLESVKRECSRLRETERGILEVKTELGRLEGFLEQRRKQMESIRGSLGERAGLLEETVRSEEARVREELNRLAEMERRTEEKRREIIQRRSNLLAERDTKLRDISRLEREVARKREREAMLNQLRGENLDLAAAELDEEARRIAEETGRLTAAIRETEEAIAELDRAGSTCPVCESPLSQERKAELAEKKRREAGEARRMLEQVRRRGLEISERLRVVRQKIEEMRAIEREVEDLRQKEAELEAARARVEEIERMLPEVERELAEVEAEIWRLRERIEEARGREREIARVIEDMRRLREIEAEVRMKEAQVETLGRKLAELEASFDGERLKEAERRQDELQARLRRLEAEVSSARERVRQLRRKIEEAEERKRQIERWDREVGLRREVAAALRALQQVLVRVQVDLRQEFLHEVNEIMNNLWADLYPYGDYTGVRLNATEDDYVLQLRERGGSWINVEGFASGGERTVACLALRVALAILLAPKLRWIVFDEPTHNLDERSVQELARVMRERLPAIVRQVILITHDPNLEAAVSGSLYRFTRDKGTDGPTVCEQVSVEPYAA